MKQFVTSNTGASQILTPTVDEKVKIYDSYANAVSCIACLAEGEIVATKSGNPLDMDTVECMIDCKVGQAASYSTTEVATGGTWINGCPIYKRTFSIGPLPNTTLKYVPTGLTNAHLVSACGVTYRCDGCERAIPWTICNAAFMVDVSYTCGLSCMQIQSWNDLRTFQTAYMTLEYYCC